MRQGRRFLCSWVFFAGTLCVQSGTLCAQESRLVIIEHADSLIGTVIDGKEAKILSGGVRLRQDETHLACDRAVQYLESGTVVLTGNLVVKEDSLVLRAPRGIFHRNERRTEAFDGVVLNDGTVHLQARYGEYLLDERKAFFRTRVSVYDSLSTVSADSLLYFRDAKRSVAMGNVTVYFKEDHATITGHRVEHRAEEQFTRVTGDPELVQIDRSDPRRVDTLVVRSITMESYRDSLKRLVAIDSVRIVRAELSARAGLATFFSGGDSIHLRSAPVLWYERTQVTGDSVGVFMADRALRLVDVMGDAFALSQADSLHVGRYDQLSGMRLKMFFANKLLEEISVDGQASSLYHVFDEGKANGVNRMSGDRIVMKFSRGQIAVLNIFGGVQGQYIPENIVDGHELDYALAGFLIRADRPQYERAATFRPSNTSPTRK